MKTSTLKMILAAVLLCPSLLLAKAKTETCELDFAFDSAQLDEAKLNDCVAKIDADEIELFHVFATASYPGTQEYNVALSERRGKAVEAFLKKSFPKTPVQIIGGGEHPEGQKARVLAIMSTVDKDAQNLAASVAVSNYAKKVEDRRTRIGLRTSYDNYRVEDDYSYRSIGLDVSRLTKLYRNAYYAEAGLGVMRHNHDDRMDLYSVTAHVGTYAKYKLGVAGIRAFAGSLALENNEDNTSNAGGELRLGLEGIRYSAFVVGGLSKEFKSVGLDFSAKI